MNYLTGKTTKHGVITVEPWPVAGQWEQESFHREGDTLFSRGSYDSIDVAFRLVFGRNGLRASYELLNPSETCDLTALCFELDYAVDHISWQRDAIWSTMPGDHIGRETGQTSREGAHPAPSPYREKPLKPWKDDVRDYVLYGKEGRPETGFNQEEAVMGVDGRIESLPAAELPSCNDYRAMKENLDWYRVSRSVGGKGLRAVRTSGQMASRIELADKQIWLIADRWRYAGTDINWGNYFGTVQLKPGSRGSFDLIVD
jgi:hypothetical protein